MFVFFFYYPIEKKGSGKYKKSDITKFFEINKNRKVMKEINLVDEKKFYFEDKKKSIKNILFDEIEQINLILYNTYEDTSKYRV